MHVISSSRSSLYLAQGTCKLVRATQEFPLPRIVRATQEFPLPGCSYLQISEGHPGVWWEAFHKRDEELNAAVPVTEKQHPEHEVQYGSYGPGRAQRLHGNTMYYTVSGVVWGLLQPWGAAISGPPLPPTLLPCS